ncbi:hypothetical protein LshimejAT787_1104450 [Lyophyllum shimeji]|uniref:Uncharacterized protein n=1 Tax=Lyophyllum shimeji TaxID=47721 RepID=A0A9P3USG1_LYOSH|nr:hypothetical protein LshimejAT787_1104450 [Lyophyllum shimeji]
MRFSTIIAASALLLAGFTAASGCSSEPDCASGQICCFKRLKDSRGKCYSGSCAPPYSTRASVTYRWDIMRKVAGLLAH